MISQGLTSGITVNFGHNNLQINTINNGCLIYNSNNTIRLDTDIINKNILQTINRQYQSELLLSEDIII